MLNNEDKKLYGVIFQAAGVFHPEAEGCEIKQVVVKLKKYICSRGPNETSWML